MSKQNEVIADTLALLNIARTAYGYDALTDLPNAVRGNPTDCLYYRALSDIGVERVGGAGEMTFASERIASTVATLWGVEADGKNVQAPTQFGQVIAQFDANRLPEYTER